jgi:hypothetical protein
MKEPQMRKLIFAAAAVVAIAGTTALSTPGEAREREILWCARTASNGFNGDCMYYTYAQCVAAISGLRGDCRPNPFASFGYDQPRKSRRNHHPDDYYYYR